MIGPLPGWSFRADERGVLLQPSDRPASGAIRYIERRRPVAGAAEIVRRHCARSPIALRVAGPVEELATVEGEAAFLVPLDGERGGRRLRQILGFVLVDDFYSQLVAVTAGDAERFHAAARTLLAGDAHELCHRRRCFHHAGPSGWRRTTRGSASTVVWLPTDGADASELVVPPARPARGGDSRPAADLLAAAMLRPSGELRAVTRGPFALESFAGSTARGWETDLVRGEETAWTRLVALIQDGAFAYALHLDSPPRRVDENRRHLAAVVRSVAGLPRVARRVPDGRELGHWIS